MWAAGASWRCHRTRHSTFWSMKGWRPQSLAWRWSAYAAEREYARRTKWKHQANRLLQRGNDVVPGTTMRSEAARRTFSPARAARLSKHSWQCEAHANPAFAALE